MEIVLIGSGACLAGYLYKRECKYNKIRDDLNNLYLKRKKIGLKHNENLFNIYNTRSIEYEKNVKELKSNYNDLSNDDIKKLANNIVKIKYDEDIVDIKYNYKKEIDELDNQIFTLTKQYLN